MPNIKKKQNFHDKACFQHIDHFMTNLQAFICKIADIPKILLKNFKKLQDKYAHCKRKGMASSDDLLKIPCSI